MEPGVAKDLLQVREASGRTLLGGVGSGVRFRGVRMEPGVAKDMLQVRAASGSII